MTLSADVFKQYKKYHLPVVILKLVCYVKWYCSRRDSSGINDRVAQKGIVGNLEYSPRREVSDEKNDNIRTNLPLAGDQEDAKTAKHLIPSGSKIPPRQRL